MQHQRIDQIAGELGRLIELDAVLKPEAFLALAAGDLAEHDRIVLAEVERLAGPDELVTLAQTSMARWRTRCRPVYQCRCCRARRWRSAR